MKKQNPLQGAGDFFRLRIFTEPYFRFFSAHSYDVLLGVLAVRSAVDVEKIQPTIRLIKNFFIALLRAKIPEGNFLYKGGFFRVVNLFTNDFLHFSILLLTNLPTVLYYAQGYAVNRMTLGILSFHVDYFVIFEFHSEIIYGEKSLLLFADKPADARLICQRNGDKIP